MQQPSDPRTGPDPLPGPLPGPGPGPGPGHGPATLPAAGDPAPRLALTLAGGGAIDLADNEFAGRPQILLIHDPAQTRQADACAALLHERIGARLPRLLCATVSRGPRQGTTAVATAATAEPPWARAILPLEGRADTLPVAAGAILAWLVAPNGHLHRVWAEPLPGEALAQAQALAELLAEDLEGFVADAEIRPGGHHPPVLMVPDVLSRAECRRLMTIYTMRGQKFVEPGHNVTGQTTDYKMRIPDYGREDRVDHWVIDRDTNQFIDDRLQPRLLPEIHKAFQYRVTRREFYRIARYAGSRGGQPIPHRDNSLPNVAHRRFAVTVNLNSEDFDGGSLRFPEFSEHRYRPATGAAIVFSCSLLHEVMAIERGTRFALLAFVYGDV